MNNQAMSNRFQMFWFEGPLSWIELHSFRSFVRFPGTRLHVYSYDKNVDPKIDGVEWEDANEILPLTIADQFRRLFDKYGSRYHGTGYSWASDAFRYKLLYERGGWYFDTDCILVKPLTPFYSFDLVYAMESRKHAAPGVMKFPRGHPMLKEMYEECLRISEGLSERNPEWPTFGPRVFTEHLKKAGLLQSALTPEYFYPVPHGNVEAFQTPFRPGENTFIIHLWSQNLRRKQWTEKDLHPSILNPTSIGQPTKPTS